MKAPLEKISSYMFFAILIIEVTLLLIIWNSAHEDISFRNEALETLNSDWAYTDADGNIKNIELPVSMGNSDIIRINHIMPDYIQSDWVLTTLSDHESINVYLDQNIIFTRGAENKLPFDLAPGSMWDIINLPAKAAGKTITLEIIPDHSYSSGVVNEVYIGSKSAFLLHIISARGLNIFLSLIILLIGMTLIIIYLSMMKYLRKNKSILFLGMFSFMVSLYMLMESDMMQFFIDNRYLIATLKYLSLLTIPIPIMFYISLVDGYRYKKHVLLLNNAFIANAAVMILLQSFSIMNFHDGLIVLHLLIVGIFSIVFIQICIEVIKYKNRSIQYFIYSFGILFIFSLIEIVSYNFNLYSNTGSFLQIGVIIFMSILSYCSMKKVTEIVQVNEHAKQYEYLATRDYMTKCKNRNAYSTELEHISLDQNIAIILADINNTKYINDTYGHHAGDFIIVRCSQCLLSMIANDEYCYRIGGDEFVCILHNQNEKIVKEKIESFFKECAVTNADCPYPFEVSIGYALYDKNLDKNIYDTVKRADKDMYRKKDGMKFSSI